MKKNVVDVIFEASEKVHNDRTPHRVLAYLVEEVGELAVEVSIAAGVKNREPSVDGIIGETVDVLVCALDLLHVYAPDVTADDLAEIAKKKCGKWLKNEEALANR